MLVRSFQLPFLRRNECPLPSLSPALGLAGLAGIAAYEDYCVSRLHFEIPRRLETLEAVRSVDEECRIHPWESW